MRLAMDSLTASTPIEGLESVLPLLEEARHEEALPLIEDRVAKQPDAPVWRYLKALVVACQARGAESVALLKETSKLEGFRDGFGLPTDVNTLARASALNHLAFETSVEPTAVEPWLHLEEVARILSNEDFLSRAILGRWKANPEDEGAPRRFERHFSSKTLDEKVKMLEEILEKEPESCLPRACLGWYMQEKGKTALAIRHLKKALECEPNAWQPHLYLGRVFLSQSRFEEAEAQFTEAISLRKHGSAELLAEIAACQKATYRYEEALETFFQALEGDPENFTHWTELSELAGATGAGERLARTIDQVSQSHPHNLDLVSRAVELSLSSGDPLEAFAKLERSGILADPGQHNRLACQAAEVLGLLGQSEKAVELGTRALKSEPRNKALRATYGLSLLATERAQEAEAVLKETALGHPNDRHLQILWGRSLMALGEPEKAHRAFGLASRLDPDDSEAMAEQGLALLAMGQPNEAMPLLKESAKKSDPPSAVTLVGLGLVYEKKGLKDIAKDFFRQSVVRDPGRSTGARGWLRMTRGDGKSLRESVLEMLKEKSSDFERTQLFLNLLQASLWEGSGEAARVLHQEVYGPLKEMVSSSGYLQFLESHLLTGLPHLASVLEQSGEFEKAREVWRFAVTSNQSELSQRATAELLRLDTVEAALAEQSPQTAAETAPTPSPEPVSLEPSETLDLSSEDPLLSLLSSTLPAEEQPASPGPESALEAELFATAPSLEQTLFESGAGQTPTAGNPVPLFATPGARPAVPTSPDEEAPLFAAGPAEIVAPVVPEPIPQSAPLVPEQTAFDQQETPLLEDIPVVDAEQVESPDSGHPDTAEALALGLDPSGEPAAIGSLEASLFALSEEESSVAEPTIETDVLLAPLSETTEPAPQSLVPSPDPSPPVETPPESLEAPTLPTTQSEVETDEQTFPVESSPLAESTVSTEAVVQETAPLISPSELAPTPSEPEMVSPEERPAAIQPPAGEPIVEPRKDLLAIPMPVDFDPNTRRQLHFHEAMAQSPGGVVAPEMLAHLMVATSLGHQPPDPTSGGDPSQETEALQNALTQSAHQLAELEQYRSATRLLKTALVYAPNSKSVSSALIDVQSQWAQWLVTRNEFAHAVALMRDCHRRNPEAEHVTYQLEAIYQEWMKWSEASGDPAARDLLAVYLQQEMATVEEFRAHWQAAEARRNAPPSTPVVPAPAVAATMPEAPASTLPSPTPSAQAPSEAIPQAEVKSVEPPSAAETAAEAPSTEPVASEPVSEPVAPAPAVATPDSREATPTETVASASPAADPVTHPVEVEPQPVEVTQSESAPVEPTAVSSVVPPAADSLSFGSSEEAIAALTASPADETVSEAVFAYHHDNMRNLTSILRDKVSESDEPVWLLLLARAFRRSGSETMAVIQYQKYIKAAPTPEAYEELAATYEELGKEDFAKMTRRKAERAFS